MLDEKFFTTEQVANILQVHPFTILKFIKQGKLKGIKLGRVYRIMESDVNAFLESRMTKSGSKTAQPAAQKPETKQEAKVDQVETTDHSNQTSQNNTQALPPSSSDSAPEYKIDTGRGTGDDKYYII